MRVITGKFKGKKLFKPIDRLTRPLKNIVKEAIFNLINHSHFSIKKIENSIIFDIFAGTGSFGIECISRGAKKVLFVENHHNALKILKKNLKQLKDSSNYEIYEKDSYFFFKNLKNLKIKSDYIFLDPPFKDQKIKEILEEIYKNKNMFKDNIIVLHRHKKDDDIIDKLNVIDIRIYGLSKIYLIKI